MKRKLPKADSAEKPEHRECGHKWRPGPSCPTCRELAWRRANRASSREHAARYYRTHKKACNARTVAWQRANRDKHNQQQRQRRAKNREHVRAQKRRYYLRHREKYLAYARRYRVAHQEEINAQKRRYYLRHRGEGMALADLPTHARPFLLLANQFNRPRRTRRLPPCSAHARSCPSCV